MQINKTDKRVVQFMTVATLAVGLLGCSKPEAVEDTGPPKGGTVIQDTGQGMTPTGQTMAPNLKGKK